MHERYAVARRTGQRQSGVVEAFVGELPEVTPGSDFDRTCEAGVLFSLIAAELQFANEECGVAQAEIQTVSVACVGIAGAGSRWIAIKGCEKERRIFVEVDFQTHARRR